jgi:hypothetical protein
VTPPGEKSLFIGRLPLKTAVPCAAQLLHSGYRVSDRVTLEVCLMKMAVRLIK